jgi:hypothetical protein
VAAVNIIGAVSPTALPIERIAPVIMPDTAFGKTTLSVVVHFEAPRDNEASRKEFGTALRASSVVDMTIGRHITPRVSAPDKTETPKFKTLQKKAKPKSPNTMEGNPANVLVPVLIKLVKRPVVANSFKKKQQLKPRLVKKKSLPQFREGMCRLKQDIYPPLSLLFLGGWVRKLPEHNGCSPRNYKRKGQTQQQLSQPMLIAGVLKSHLSGWLIFFVWIVYPYLFLHLIAGIFILRSD